jgi:hypothetical protein
LGLEIRRRAGHNSAVTQTTPNPRKEARLAAALRENLKRRKDAPKKQDGPPPSDKE